VIAAVDTGFIVAVALKTDQRHDLCLAVYRQCERIILPQSVLAEVAYFLTGRAGNKAVARFIYGLDTTKYQLAALERADLVRAANLLDIYADSRLDFIDASVAAVAERLGITLILTLDRRDFQIIRPHHVDYFELLPRLP
jgi:predicted nucleic acid-binding protein